SITCCRSWRLPRWGRRPAAVRRHLRTRRPPRSLPGTPPIPPPICAGNTTALQPSTAGPAARPPRTHPPPAPPARTGRWAGVPFFIRTGKRLPLTHTELRLVFKYPPKLGFGLRGSDTEPDQIVIKLDPATGIRFTLEARQAGGTTMMPINLDMEFVEQG